MDNNSFQPESKGTRVLNVNISEDKMQADISIGYSGDQCVKYTDEEVIGVLKNKGIVYGLDLKAIRECILKDEVNNCIVARGKRVVDPIDDELKIFFNTGDNDKLKEDHKGNIDFKSIGNVASVKPKELLAEKIQGKDGVNGINIFSKAVSCRKRKTVDVMVKDGCEIVGNTVVATLEGQPHVKSNVFKVCDVYEVNSDVDLSTGNVNFVGDVIIRGNVNDGMDVKAGNKLMLSGNAMRCSLWSENDMSIAGNALSSDIKIESQVSEMKDYVAALEEMRDAFGGICEAVSAVKHSGHFKAGINDNAIIKLIIESKFPSVHFLAKKLTKAMVDYKNDYGELFMMLKIKFVTKNYLLIQSLDEIYRLKQEIEDRIATIKSMRDLKSDGTFKYLQDCTVYSSGNIFVGGKGVYKSNLHAEDKIFIQSEGHSEVRGGKLYAENELHLKVVGAENGVTTELEVGKQGHIYCEFAHFNTSIKVGNYRKILDEDCKKLHAYIDKDNELVIEKFKA